MPTYIALLRGINVGRAKRVSMADLREAVASLGHDRVRTLLNSGNVVFESARTLRPSAATAIRDAVASRTGVTSEVLLVSARDLDAIVRENPLSAVATEPARLLVTFPYPGADLSRAAPLTKDDWTPEAFALGARAAYLWCAEGIHTSKLMLAFGRLMGDTYTARNWATVLKLHAASRPDPKN